MPGDRSRSADDRTARIGGRLLRTRWLVRAPIWLFRLRLGFVFGSRLLLLEHVGRVSGRRRYVVLEVIDRSETGVVVASGFGARAQWYRNLRARPDDGWVTVGGRRRRPVRARLLSGPEIDAVLQRYTAAHPGAWARLRPVLEQTLGVAPTGSDQRLPLVALDYADELPRP